MKSEEPKRALNRVGSHCAYKSAISSFPRIHSSIRLYSCNGIRDQRTCLDIERDTSSVI